MTGEDKRGVKSPKSPKLTRSPKSRDRINTTSAMPSANYSAQRVQSMIDDQGVAINAAADVTIATPSPDIGLEGSETCASAGGVVTGDASESKTPGFETIVLKIKRGGSAPMGMGFASDSPDGWVPVGTPAGDGLC